MDSDVMAYPYDGYGNNIENPNWGAALTGRIRVLPDFASYYDDPDNSSAQNDIPKDETNSNLPSARRVMELLFRKAPQLPDKLTNHLLFEFGHVISQDLVGSSPWNTSEPFPIPCDGNKADYLFCPGFIRKYLYFPYIALVVLLFAGMEIAFPPSFRCLDIPSSIQFIGMTMADSTDFGLPVAMGGWYCMNIIVHC